MDWKIHLIMGNLIAISSVVLLVYVDFDLPLWVFYLHIITFVIGCAIVLIGVAEAIDGLECKNRT